MIRKNPVSITTFKKWPFANDFRIETEDVKGLSALCKYCPKVEYDDFMGQARSTTLKALS